MSTSSAARRLIVGMSGASGLPYGVRLLEVLQSVPDVETHLVMTEAAKLTAGVETDLKVAQIEAMADVVHGVRNISAPLASGSFKVDGMVVAPCSMRTLAAIVHSYADNLLVRAADVTLKERRRLVVMPRETPLSVGHCKLLYEASLQHVIVCPPMPGFYMRPKTIDDLVDAAVGRALDLFDIDAGIVKRWEGIPGREAGEPSA